MKIEYEYNELNSDTVNSITDILINEINKLKQPKYNSGYLISKFGK